MQNIKNLFFLTGERRKMVGRQRSLTNILALTWFFVAVIVLGTTSSDSQRHAKWLGLVALGIILAVGKLVYQLKKGETWWQLDKKQRETNAATSTTSEHELIASAAQIHKKHSESEH